MLRHCEATRRMESGVGAFNKTGAQIKGPHDIAETAQPLVVKLGDGRRCGARPPRIADRRKLSDCAKCHCARLSGEWRTGGLEPG